MPLILGAQSATTAAAVVTNSCRFNQPDSASMTLTMGTPTNADKYTLSMWVKRGSRLGVEGTLFVGGTSSSNGDIIMFRAPGELEWQMYHGGWTAQYKTNRLFLDPGAWYHLVFTYDSGNATAGDRMKIYVNGTEETSFAIENDVAQDTDSLINAANLQAISDDGGLGLTNTYFDGYFAEVALCDGQTYAASDFGEFNADSPTIWQPVDVSGLTFGDNGFLLDFEDSSALGADVSGNSNDWTANNLDATDQATDTPVNNFCVNNPLDNFFYGATFSEGNCKIAMDASSNETYGTTTIGLSAGKWYWEVKWTSDTGGNNLYMGITNAVSQSEDDYYLGRATGEYAYAAPYGYWVTAASGTTYGDTYAPGDIIGVYLDLDNNKLYFGKNGTVQASGTGIDITAIASTTHGFYWPAVSYAESGSTCLVECNYGGCPSFTVSSGNTDTNGYGNFEYDPSSGTFDSASKDFLAICTKNLGSDGG